MTTTEEKLLFPDPVVTESFRVQAWGYTFLLVFLYLVNWADKALLGLVAQPLAHELHLSASQIGLAGSAFFLAFTLSGLLAGVISKRSSLQWSLGLIALAWAICLVPMTLLPSFTMLLVTRSALGLAEGPNSALLHTALYSWHPPARRGVPSAWVTACSSLTKILSAPVLTMVIVSYGWRAAFWTLAAISVVWCFVWLAVWVEGPFGQRAGSTVAAESTVPQARASWIRVFCSPTFIGCAVAVTSMYMLITAVITWLPSYFEIGLGFTRLQAGTMFGFPGVAALFTMFGTGYIGDLMQSRGRTARVFRGGVLAVGLLLCGLSMVVLPYIHSQLTAVILISFGYGAGSIALPLSNACVSQICPPRQLPGALGLFFSVMSVGGIVAPYVTGLLVDSAVSPAAGYARAFQAFGIAAIIASAVAVLTINPERDCLNIDALTKG
jgi:sugar phosphate permease